MSIKQNQGFQSIIDSPILKELAQTAYDMWFHGWDEYNGGNISYLLDDKEANNHLNVLKEIDGRQFDVFDIPTDMVGRYLFITASGSHFRTLKHHLSRDTGFIKLTEHGYKVIWGFSEDRHATSEFFMHILSHESRLKATDQQKVVVHNHATNVVTHSLIVPTDDRSFTIPLWRSLTESIVVFPDGVGVLPWEAPGTLSIGKHTAEKLKSCRIVSWTWHGVLATGKDFQDCFGLIETVDKAAKIYRESLNFKQYEGLSDDNLLEVCKSLNVLPREGLLK